MHSLLDGERRSSMVPSGAATFRTGARAAPGSPCGPWPGPWP